MPLQLGREDELREEKLASTCPPRVVLNDLGVTGLKPATRGRSKHQVQRVASGVGTLLRLAGRRHEMISRVEMVDRPQQCARRDASDARDAASRRPRQTRVSSRRDAIINLSFSFSGRGPFPSPAPIRWTACHGSAFLKRTAPGLVRASPIGWKMTHTLIWHAARAKRFVTIFGAKSTAKHTPPGAWNSTHARMPASAKSADNAASSVVVVVVDVKCKNSIYKIINSARTINFH